MMGSRARWAMLALIFLCRVAMALQFQSIAPVASLLVAELGLTYAQLGLLIGLYLLPGAVIAFPGSMLGQRFGNRRVALWALALMAIGGLGTATSQAFWLAGAGRILSGVGGVLLTLILTKMTADWFATKELSTAMSIMLTGWPFGIALGTASFGAIAMASSWRVVQHIATVTTAVSFLMLAVLYRDAPGTVASDTKLRFWPGLPARPAVRALVAGFVWMSFNVGFIVLIGFTPAFLVARGTSLAEAGMVVSLAVWVSVFSAPLGGAVADRTRRPDLAIGVGCLVTALDVIAMPFMSAAVAPLLVAGLMMGAPPGAIVALVPKSVNAENLAAAYGLFYVIYYLGMASMQPLAGLLRDVTGSPAAPIFFAAAMMALTVVALRVFRWIDRSSVPT